MMFSIDTRKPSIDRKFASYASDLGEAIQLCFPLHAEDARMTLGQISIPISYKYDLSIILEEILFLLKNCLDSKNSKIRFGSDTFNSDWDIRCIENQISFNTCWYSVVGNRESDLNKIGNVVVSKEYFITQWLELLKVGIGGVKRSGMNIEDLTTLNEIERLLTAFSIVNKKCNL